MWNIHSQGASPGNPASMMWAALAAWRGHRWVLGVHSPSWVQPQSSQPECQAWSLHRIPVILSCAHLPSWGPRHHPCLCPEFLTTEPVSTERVRWLLLHPHTLKGGVTCYAATDNWRNSSGGLGDQRPKKQGFWLPYTNSIKMLESAFCHISHPSVGLSHNFWLRDSKYTLLGYC